MLQRTKRMLVTHIQPIGWVYLTNNFYLENVSQLVSPLPRIPLRLVRITPDNVSRVQEFRTRDRCAEYARKLAKGEVGYFAVAPEGTVGSQWATLNRTKAPIVARGYVPLPPGEALLHDGVTGEKYRGKGVGPFMVAGVLAALMQEYGMSRVVIDVKVTNRPALRMMEKVGLTAREATLAVSAFGSLVWRLKLPAHS